MIRSFDLRPHDGPFGFDEAAHLLRRTCFGATPAQIERVVRGGLLGSVANIVDGRPPRPWIAEQRDMGRRISLAGRGEDLRAHWLHRMISTTHPFREHLALFWRDVFATDATKVGRLADMQRQFDVFVDLGSADLGLFYRTMLKDPALLIALDANENERRSPNENLARELLELYALGYGAYDESDVREAARALTGWHLVEGRQAFVAAAHDGGVKSVLGRSGRFDGAALLELCLGRREHVRHVATRLWRFFVSEAMPDGFAERLEALLEGSGRDVGGYLRRLFGSRAFFASRGALVKSPVQLVAGAARAVGGRADAVALADLAADLGEDLLHPPSVAGWARGRAWITSRTMILRQNFGASLADGREAPVHGGAAAIDLPSLVRAQLGRSVSPSLLEKLVDAPDALGVLGRIASLPEYQAF